MQDPSRRRARLIMIIGFVLAAFAGIGAFLVASSGSQAPATTPANTVEVLVAARDLPARATVAAGDVRSAQVPTTTVPAGALTDPATVVGRITSVPIAAGEVLLPTKVIAATAAGFTVFPANEQLTATSPAYRAMSITVADPNAVGGAVVPGDIVDLMYTLPTLDPTQFTTAPVNAAGGPTVKIALERIPILAKTGNVYTIRVDATTAERIQYLQVSGAQLSFLLRAAQDDRASGTQGATFGPIYQEYRFRIPTRVAP